MSNPNMKEPIDETVDILEIEAWFDNLHQSISRCGKDGTASRHTMQVEGSRMITIDVYATPESLRAMTDMIAQAALAATPAMGNA